MSAEAGRSTNDTLALVAEPLTAEAFRPYGDVIALGGPSDPINQGKGRRYPRLAQGDFDATGGAAVSLMTCVPEPTPVPLRLMERHPKGNQVFYPADHQRYLVVVAPPGAPPRAGALRAFLCRGDQGVNYHRGVWHHPMIALDHPCTFVEMHWAGPGGNCDETPLARPVTVHLPDGQPRSAP